jgi:formamidopyrimidine-DNA glycosylase
MPELPEVETIRLQLADILIGKIIQSIEIHAPKSFHGDSRILEGKKINAIDRYGKMIVIRLNNSPSLAIHLKMTGQVLYRLPNLPDVYTRVTVHFSDGDIVFFNDIRRFGWMKIMDNETMNNVIKKLGPDALVITKKMFQALIQRSNQVIKTVLMNQEKIAGVGNIYANDALFLANIYPTRKANTLNKKEIDLLFDCLQRVLREGVKYRGASKTNFKDVYGEKGSAQDHFHVYDREGTPCPNECGEIIKRIVVGGRGTFYCRHCQQ